MVYGIDQRSTQAPQTRDNLGPLSNWYYLHTISVLIRTEVNSSVWQREGFWEEMLFSSVHSGGPNLKLHCQKIYWLSSLQPELSRSVITLPNWLIKVLFPTTGNVFPERTLINSSFHFNVIVPLLIRSLESCLASLFLILILMQHPFQQKSRLWVQDAEVGPAGMSDSLGRA